MQAMILAAGMGRRLKELTQNNTKCMIEVNGVTLIERMLHQLEQHEISRIVMVVGYEREKLKKFISSLDVRIPIEYIVNKDYSKTNNIFSLALAKNRLCDDDTILLESDLIFEDGVLDTLINDKRDTLALVDKYESWMDGTCVKLSEDDTIESFVLQKNFNYSEIDRYYKTVNIYKFSKTFSQKYYVPFLEAYQTALGQNEYYEQVLRVIAMLNAPVIRAKRLDGQRWYEIDDIQDLDIAESMFTPDEDERVELLQRRYGGYWRYPDLLDFCYLVNPYYPPKRMINEIKASFETLLTEYPSGLRVNTLLASKNFNIHQENIVVGNGAAELIKSVMENMEGRVGVIRPTFEEYSHRYDKEKVVAFTPRNDDYTYGVDDLMAFFSENAVNNIVLINPDNPSGNYIPREDILRFIEWTGNKNIRLVLDESFIDFADEEDGSVLGQRVIEANKHLVIIKSISKSFGVPGLRLGIMASGDESMIEKCKQDVAIWNINSFAEFYLQIAEKYRREYAAALKEFRHERKRYMRKLAEIRGLRVIPSQANYIMAEIMTGISAAELTRRLIVKHSILIKNLNDKMDEEKRQYIRLAIRNSEDNDALIRALHSELD